MPSFDWLYPVASQGISVLPSGPLVYSVSLICSVSQIDSFWKTFVLSKLCESSIRSIVIEPPRGGVAFVDTPAGACVLRHYHRGGLAHVERLEPWSSTGPNGWCSSM